MARERWTGFTDPDVLAFIAKHASEPPARVEMLVDKAARIWVYEMSRNGWVCGDRFVADEERAVFDAECGPLIEVRV